MRPAPAQDACADIVRANPGIVGLDLAERCGPNASRRYGYGIIHRAVNSGRIVQVDNPKRKGSYIYFVPDPTICPNCKLYKTLGNRDQCLYCYLKEKHGIGETQ